MSLLINCLNYINVFHEYSYKPFYMLALHNRYYNLQTNLDNIHQLPWNVNENVLSILKFR